MCRGHLLNIWHHLKSPLFNSELLFRYNLLRCLSTKPEIFKKKELSRRTLQPQYNPKDAQAEWYDWWDSQNYFKPNKSENESFVVLLPPPNITGTLHLGHALTTTIQDVILRWCARMKRMKGESVLWVPGIDHAGIATQAVVEKHLLKTMGLTRYQLGRSDFVKRVKKWKKLKQKTIVHQLKELGASLDWSKLIFTMDPVHSQLVTESFIKLYNDGLIYQMESLVNWSCAMKSSISDIEVDWVDISKRTALNVPGYEKPVDFGVLYEFAYKFCEEDGEIVVSTTRPETMLGDVAVAVHPDNPNLSKLQNRFVWHPFRQEKIPIIVDDFVDSTLGTGAVKITPSHSRIDFDVALKHDLPRVDVIDESGLIKKIGVNEKLHGLKRFEARNVIISELKALGLFRGYKPHPMKLPLCSRSGDVIEMILKKQWFLKCKSLAERAINAVKKGELRLEPEQYNGLWMSWLNEETIRDWNLSRQLWWGHSIPMYECTYQDESVWVAAESPEDARTKASNRFNVLGKYIKVVQDPDVLDTWFSSGLLPLNPAIDQTRRTPIDLMVTGNDIMFFWVAKMVMLSLHLTGELPFRNVYLHSLVCDPKGKKMSKSVGNVIHPEDIIHGISAEKMKAQLEQNFKDGLLSKENFQKAMESQKKMFPKGIPECGVDGLRLTLCSTTLNSAYVNFDVDLCQSSRFFCNKIWQGMMYFFKIFDGYNQTFGEFEPLDLKSSSRLNVLDKWILSGLASVVETVDDSIATFNFHQGTKALRLFFVNKFCDFYLESTKWVLKDAPADQYQTTTSVFFYCFETFLRLMSPFMPFVTEQLYNALPPFENFNKSESLTTSQFPKSSEWRMFRDDSLEKQLEIILKVLSSIRRMKKVYSLKESKQMFVRCNDDLAEVLFGDTRRVFNAMVGVQKMTRTASVNTPNTIHQQITDGCHVFLEHPYDRKTLETLLAPAMSKEEKVKGNLEKLLRLAEEEVEEAEKRKHQKKISNLQSEMEEIGRFKKVIENCER